MVDWSGSDEDVGEGRILSSDPDDLVNDCRLGPKGLVESATKADAFLWRPATKMFTMEEAVGQIIAWPASKCVLLDKELQIEDIAPLVIFYCCFVVLRLFMSCYLMCCFLYVFDRIYEQTLRINVICWICLMVM